MIDSRKVSSSIAIEENLNIGRKMMEAVNKQDLKLLDDLVALEYVNRNCRFRVGKISNNY